MIVLYNKSLQESLHEVESDSTFRNDADNAEMHFFYIAQYNIHFANCLAICLLTSQ